MNNGTRDLKTTAAHRALYAKLRQIYDIMGAAANREEELTKRWRVTRGPMTLVERGSVWEGWGVVLDQGIEMDAWERKGAIFHSGLVDDGMEVKKVDEEVARRRREIEELLAEEEDVSDEESMET